MRRRWLAERHSGQPAGPGSTHGGFRVDDRVRFGFRVGTIYRFKMQRGRWFAVVQPDEPVLPLEVPVAELRREGESDA